jgi:hypothetical protein
MALFRGLIGRRRVDGDIHTRTGVIVGTPCYMAPEQARADKVLTTGVDVYSLGAILYQLLIGRPPFQAETPLDTALQVLERDPEPLRKINPRIARDLETICLVLSIAYAADRSSTANRFEKLNGELQAESERTRAAFKEANRQLAIVALERAEREHGNGEVGRAMLRVVESVHFAQAAGDDGVERKARVAISAWQGELHRLRSVVPGPPPAEGLRFGLVALSAGGRSALVASFQSARLIDPASGRPLGPPLRYPGVAVAVAISLEGNTVAVVEASSKDVGDPTGSSTQVRLWDASSGKPIGSPVKYPPGIRGIPGLITAIALSPDGKILLTSGIDGTIRRWDVVSGHEIGGKLSPGHKDAISGIGFSPDGRIIAGKGVGWIWLWDAASGRLISSGLDHPQGVLGFAFSGDGKTLLTAGYGGAARLWDIGSSKEVMRIETGAELLRCVAVSPHGRSIVTGSDSGGVRIWDVGTGKPIGPPLVHAQNIVAAVFRPDGLAVITATFDGTLSTWDLAGSPATLSTALTWKTDGTVNALAFAPTAVRS